LLQATGNLAGDAADFDASCDFPFGEGFPDEAFA
jgi:hypothetical protein